MPPGLELDDVFRISKALYKARLCMVTKTPIPSHYYQEVSTTTSNLDEDLSSYEPAPTVKVLVKYADNGFRVPADPFFNRKMKLLSRPLG